MKRIEEKKKSGAIQLLQHRRGALREHEPDSVNFV